jgi:hypothetical protein
MNLRHTFFVFVILIFLIMNGCAAKPAIIKAADSGDSSTIKRLQAEGQNINERDSRGATALMNAIWSKKTNVAKLLIESGADVKPKDIDGMDALMYAVSYGQDDLINILLDKGADIESRDSQGGTPLVYAAVHTINIDAVKLLIKRGANVNTENNISQPILSLVFNMKVTTREQEKKNGLSSLLMGKSKTPDIIINELVNAGANIYEPSKGKARLILFLDDSYKGVPIAVNGRYLSADNRINYVDVNPGKCEFYYISRLSEYIQSAHLLKLLIGVPLNDIMSNYITLNPGEGSPHFSTDVKAGQTYYVKMLLVDKNMLVSRYKWGLVEESAAKAKIKGLL